MRTRVGVTGNAVRLARPAAEALGVTVGGTVGVTVLKEPGRAARTGTGARSAAGRAKGARPRGTKAVKPARSTAKRR